MRLFQSPVLAVVLVAIVIAVWFCWTQEPRPQAAFDDIPKSIRDKTDRGMILGPSIEEAMDRLDGNHDAVEKAGDR